MARSKLGADAEYAALRIVCGFLNSIPYAAAIAAARGFASFAVKVLGFKRKRTLSRIKSVFPGISDAEAEKIAVSSLANVMQSAVEMMRAERLDRNWMDRNVKDGAFYKDRLQEYVDEGNGVVVMVPHMGNFYMAAWSMAKYGLKLCALGAPQRNKKIDAWMKRKYGDIVFFDRAESRTLIKIKQALQGGHVFAILPDLRVRNKDVEADFLNGKANVSHAGAMFAVKCGCPIVVAAMHRDGGKHVFHHIATLRANPNADSSEEAVRLTKEALRLLSDEIMKSPGEWYWYNKRWILEPV